MGIFLRFLLFFFSIAVVLIAVFSMLVGFEFYSQSYVNGIIDSIYNNIEYKIAVVSISILFIMTGLYLFFRSMFSKRDNTTFSTNSTDSGLIKVSIDTLENIALNATKKVEGIREPKIRVKIDSDESVSFIVHILVDGEKSIPQISEEIQNNIKDNIEQIAGLSVKRVHVVVTNISSINKSITKKSKSE